MRGDGDVDRVGGQHAGQTDADRPGLQEASPTKVEAVPEQAITNSGKTMPKV
jgi:hypothetical protein